jgi:PAS domain S-box-containing protein
LHGRHVQALLEQATNGPVNPEAFHKWVQTAIAEGRRTDEGVFHLLDGTVLQLDYLPLRRHDQVVLHLWNFENITKQHYAQESIRRLSQLAEHGPNPVVCFDRAGEALYANNAARKLLPILTAPESEEAALVRRVVDEVLHTQQTRTAEYPVDGHFYIWTVVPLPDEQRANVYLTDISARRRTEAELRRSQHLLARINDTLPNIVFVYDLQQQRLVYHNVQAELMLGYSAAELQGPIQELYAQLFSPDDRPSLDIADFPALQEGEVIQKEMKFHCRDGSVRQLSYKITSFLRDDAGRIYQIIGTAEDVTAQRKAEQELAHSQYFLSRIADTVPNTIYLFDLQEDRNLYTSRYLQTMLGFTEQELLDMGTSFTNRMGLVVQQDVSQLQQHYTRLRSANDGEVLVIEFRMRHRNGSVRWVRQSDTVFARDANGQVTQIVGAAEDVTERNQAEEERREAFAQLAEQNRLFRQVIDAAPHLIYLKDYEGRYVLANQATADLYSLSLEDLINRPPALLPGNPADVALFISQDKQVISTRQELTTESIFHRTNGSRLYFYTIKRPFVQADGTVLVLGVASNITDLKHTQQQLEQAKESAEESARVKQEFLTNISHEIRTPLNGIMGMAGLLAKTPLEQTQAQYLGHIRQSAEHLLVLINDVLSTAQLGAGRVQLERIPFDLVALLRDSLSTISPRATEKGLELNLELPPDAQSLIVLGDPHRLRQIVFNLLGNAIKFTNTGHVALRCTEVARLTSSATFQFSVTDTGIGIPQHQLEQIFDPFTQASASTAREYGGSGLGLSISRGLVELLGGRIWAESVPGTGSTFSVELTLELAAPEVALPTELPPPDYRALRGSRVLLAEDNEVNQLLVATLLRDWGLTVDTAANGPAALSWFNSQLYDVVLMDIQMPGMDGVTTTQHIRQHPDPRRAATPVVALTAHALPEEEARCRAASMDDYLVKPFQERTLFCALMRAVGKQPTLNELPTPEEEPLVLADEKLYDLADVRRMAGTDVGFVRHMAGLFVRTTTPVVDELAGHFARQDWVKLGAAAHHLKSSVEGIGLRCLRPVLNQLEAYQTNPPEHPQEAAPLTEEVRRVLQQAFTQLREEFQLP